jgi:hypothetical protein
MDMPPQVAHRRWAIVGVGDLFQTVNQAHEENLRANNFRQLLRKKMLSGTSCIFFGLVPWKEASPLERR